MRDKEDPLKRFIEEQHLEAQKRQEDKVYESIIVVAFIAAMIALIVLSNM